MSLIELLMELNILKKDLKESFGDNRPVITFLIGAPASGKSTWRKQNQKNEKIISRDDIVIELAKKKGISYSESFNDEILQSEVNRRLTSNVLKFTYNKNDIIVDMTNMGKNSRKWILDKLSDEYIKKAVVFNVDRNELLRRIEKRGKETGQDVPIEVLDSMLSKYEEPTKEEGFDQIEFFNN
jgi:predicted kinase